MENRNVRPFGIGFLLLTLLVPAACDKNDGSDEPETVTAVFELAYATYWGGSPNANKGNAISVDKDGYIYLAGETQNPSFFLKNPVVDKTYSTTGFVSKFTPDGQTVVFSTFLGARNGYNWCLDTACDGQGDAIAAGLAGGQSFPLKNPLYDTFTQPWQCGFLSSIAPQGTTLNFSTFIPRGRVKALALDDERNIYLATMDDIILKIAADGSRLLYEYSLSTGVSSGASIEDLAVVPGGGLVAVGWSQGQISPLVHPIQAASGGLCDAFILKLDPDGDTVEFASMLGGAGNDFAYGAAVGADGSIFVCGSTASADFPLKSALDAIYNGGADCFAARIDPDNGTLVYSTFLGGSAGDKATAMALNSAGEAYLSGWTTSPDFPVRGAMQDHLGGVKDPFVTKLSANGDKILLSTYCGGSQSPSVGSSETGADWGNDICLGPDGKIYITGETYASDFPMLNPLDSENIFSKAFIAVLREKQL